MNDRDERHTPFSAIERANATIEQAARESADAAIAMYGARIPCRHGIDVQDCPSGCTLFACCGGYVGESHMSDCDGTKAATIYNHAVGPRLRSYTGR